MRNIIFYLLVFGAFLGIDCFSIEQKLLPICSENFQALYDKSFEEGFGVGTLVKTPFGYELIQDLIVGDMVIDASGHSTEIVSITKRHVDKYVKISLENTVFCVGCDQLLYSVIDNAWIRANDALFGKFKQEKIEYINGSIVIYALTTNNHTLCVTQDDFLAHNAEAIFLGASTISFGHIVISNPVIALFGGAMIGLVVVAYNAYKNYLEQVDDEKKFCVNVPDPVFLAERFYYEQRKAKLEKIAQDLQVIKQSLEVIQGLCTTNFTHQFLTQHSYNAVKSMRLFSVTQEKRLSDGQKLKLREMREIELVLLEKQIQDLQFLLALHVNQLINNINVAEISCYRTFPEIETAITAWHSNRNEITDVVTLQMYKLVLQQECLIDQLTQAFDELIAVSKYYNTCTNQCIQSTTTIVEVLQRLAPIVLEKKLKIQEIRRCLCDELISIENNFTECNISIIDFKKAVKKEFEKQKKGHNEQVLEKVEAELSRGGFPDGPKKDDEDNFWKKLKARSDKKARTIRFGKLYRDPITKLWWSKDLSGHGGSCYKVFKEGAKAFELLFDAAKDGTRMLNKHKGPIGIFISYKEVIFRT